MTTDDWDAVKRCSLFKALDPADLGLLIDAGSVVRLSRNQQLFAHGDPAEALFLIIEGQIKLTRLSPDGNEAVVHVFGAGETFAEAAMFMGGRYPVAAAAITDTRLIAISYKRLRAQVLVKPEIAFAMLASMAQHLKVLVAQIEQMKLMTTKQRAIRFLLDQSGESEGSANFTLPHDKALIANRLGMKPETFSRVMSQLAVHGVEMNGARVAIEDVGRLADVLSLE
jgi:CRP/FNR family transcriptional regulator, dissimilatory nitrate respiration regulator